MDQDKRYTYEEFFTEERTKRMYDRMFGAIHQEPPSSSASSLTVAEKAKVVLEEQANGDPNGRFYRLMSHLLARYERATREQVIEQIEALART